MAVILQEANLQPNTSESHLHAPQWATQEISALAAQTPISQSGSHDAMEWLFHLNDGFTIHLAQKGLRILDCPAGADDFSTNLIFRAQKSNVT
jgi:hypothetical protein